MTQLSSADWVSISASLEQHHALFYQCWQMGRPHFTDSVPTAAVRFLKSSGSYLDFLFNPDFWNSLTPYERLFVIAHECLHVILNHGLRTVDTKDGMRTNWALDIVVNHLLVNSFGFERSRIKDSDTLCWVDTVFKGHPQVDRIPTDAAFEYYLNHIPERPVINVRVLDDHSGLPSDWEKVIKKLNGTLSPEELGTIKDAIEKHCRDQKPEGEIKPPVWDFVNVGPARKSKKWETIIKDWSKIYLREVDRNREQWLRVNRRFWAIQGSLLLPSEQEEIEQHGDKVGVYFFLDTSGSCYHLKDRFFQAAMSLPEDRFVIRLFCFDDSVVETSLESKKVAGGAGTNFGIIESKIVQITKDEKVDYPEAVFIITDGYGSTVRPSHPERWHWFLTPQHSMHYLPVKSKHYNLADYE